jgi:hypothetical protein
MTNTDDFRVKTTAGRLVTADAPVICVNPMAAEKGSEAIVNKTSIRHYKER